MSVRAIRFYDLAALARVEGEPESHVVWPTDYDPAHSALHIGMTSAWQDVNETAFTFIDRDRRGLNGLAQVTARRGADAWDLVRLAVGIGDARELIEQTIAATGGRGSLRTFARACDDGDGARLLEECGFRPFAHEQTLIGHVPPAGAASSPPQSRLRARRRADAWGIFQLYCAVTPAGVRHAEGLSSSHWPGPSRLLDHLPRPIAAGFPAAREAVLDSDGHIVGWMRLSAISGRRRRLDVLVHPHVAVVPFLQAGLAALTTDVAATVVCSVRDYDGAILAGLGEIGFTAVAERPLYVYHTVARISERQLLVAALRAQSLGLDTSSHVYGPAPVARISSHDRIGAQTR